MPAKQWVYLIGLLSILLGLTLWAFDIAGIVAACIYCRIERTIVILLGLIIIFPKISYISNYLSYVFGFFGASVASNQIFLLLNNKTFDLELFLAICALITIIAQVFFIYVTANKTSIDTQPNL